MQQVTEEIWASLKSQVLQLFEQLNMELFDRKVRLSDSKVEGVTSFEVTRKGDMLTIYGGRQVSTKIYDFRIDRSAKEKPTTISIDSKNSKVDGWIRAFHIVGKAIWPKK